MVKKRDNNYVENNKLVFITLAEATMFIFIKTLINNTKRILYCLFLPGKKKSCPANSAEQLF